MGVEDIFEGIRPFNDEEVGTAIRGILNTEEFLALISLLVPIYYPGKPEIKDQLANANTIAEVQDVIDEIAEKIKLGTAPNFDYRGLEDRVSEDDRGFLLISNHRDIALDFLFTNLILHSKGYGRAMGAGGSNLLVSPLIATALRAYGCFIVKRGSPHNQMPKERRVLSSYIALLRANKVSVWISQQEGRAKDGNDVTKPGLIRMLYAAQEIDDEVPFSEYINSLNIIPVSVSYQYDPCDVLKARELHQRELDPAYKKSTIEDLLSIFQGIRGDKGGVYISFGEPVRGNFSGPIRVACAEVASLIDRSIQGQYHMWDTNHIAFNVLSRESLHPERVQQSFLDRFKDYSSEEKAFVDRFKDCRPEEVTFALRMYAQPLINQRKLVPVHNI